MHLRNRYDEIADRYLAMVKDRNETDLESDPLTMAFFGLIGDVAGLQVLDAGCGEGFVARVLSSRRAQLTAVDISQRLVDAGRAKDPSRTIDYRVHDLSKPLPELTGRFDLVASHLVLNDVPDYLGFIATVSSLMKPASRAVFSLNNPYSAVHREKASTYFASGEAVIYQGLAQSGVEVYHYHRTMEEYITAFGDAGLLLRSLKDIPPSEEMLLRRQWYNEVPYLMVLEFVKARSGSWRAPVSQTEGSL